MKRLMTPAALGTLLGAALLAGGPHFAEPAEPEKETRRLLADGRYLLPNGWHLSPAGRQVALGGMPLRAVMAGGRHALVLSCGATPHHVAVLDIKEERVVQTVGLKQAWLGLAVAPDGKTAYASAGGEDRVLVFAFADGTLTPAGDIKLPAKTFPAGLAVGKDGKSLFVVGNLSDSLLVVDLATKKVAAIPVGTRPYGVVPSADGKTAWVSNWGAASVAEIDLGKNAVRRTIPTQEHPNDLILSRDGRLFVANANRNTVSVIDAATGAASETIGVDLVPKSPPGSTPNALALAPDEKTLYVANADNNCLAVVDISERGESRPAGFIPTGWYPTAVCVTPDGGKLVVANGKGTASRANAALVNPAELPSWRGDFPGYSINLVEGSLSVVAKPDAATLARYSGQTHLNSPYAKPRAAMPAAPFKLGKDCPIKHVIYVIKENRTYDQVFGDMKEGEGDERYCLFPEEVTPNHHALAREFVLLDNLYHDAEVSMDGHHWVTGAYATDYIEKLWPARYAGRSTRDPDGPTADASSPYLWALCRKAGLGFRAYGETTGMTAEDRKAAPGTAPLDLPVHPTYDAWGKGDLKALDLWLADLAQFEKRGTMPRLQVVSMPGDHTHGTGRGARTPRAMVAENDLALGRLVEAVSKSRFWKETAIFVIEDDTQDGPDHVDFHRSVALVVGPHVRRGAVDSTMYSTSGMLRTMELILGLPPMTQYDAAATPMWASFKAEADAKPYKAVAARVKLDEMNAATAYGAERSEKWDLTHYDSVPEAEINEVLWKSIKGENSPVPPRRVAAFVRSRGK